MVDEYTGFELQVLDYAKNNHQSRLYSYDDMA